MKTDIHPTYGPASIVCSCGNTVETRSTKGELHVEICSNCHPFYTGKQKFLDTGGRMGKFQAKLEAAGSAPDASSKKKKANVRTFTPAVDPKALAAKAARAEAKALETAKRKQEADEAAQREREEAKLAKEREKAEAIVAAGADADADASDAPEAAAEVAPSEETPDAEAKTEDAPAEDAPAADAPAEDA